MALFKRGRVWWFEFTFAGHRYRESTRSTSKALAAEAQRKRHRELEAAVNGLTTRRRAAPLPFTAAASDWLNVNAPTWAAKTHTIATTDVGHLKAHFGGTLIVDITASDIAEYITARRKQKAADKTIRNEVGSLRGILKRHKLWAPLKEDGVRLPSVQEKEVGIALSEDQESRLLAACAASRSRSLLPAVTLALSTGLRHDELRLLRWKQVDLVNQAIRVGISKTAHSSGRVMPLNNRALTTLREWAKQFPHRKSNDFVFPSERVGFSGNEKIPQLFDTDPSKPLTSWKTAWTTARQAAGVQCRFHDLRHSVVTRLLERGQPFAVVASLMGWSPATALRMVRVYGHIGASAQREAMAALDGHAVQKSAEDTDASLSSTIQ